jgi:hypothetical protein
MMSRAFRLSSVWLLLLGASAWADSFRAPPVHLGPKISVQGYGKQNPACRAWTNGCVLCIGDGASGSRCSTTGIACQPHGITCKDLRRD